MSLWQRAIAIVTLVVFLPASVLAGTPLRYCVGDDGHRAIEFVLTSNHHAAAQHGHAVDCNDPAEHHAAPSSGCSDTPLLSVAQKPGPTAQFEQVFILDDLLPTLTVLSAIAAVPVLADAPMADPRPLHSERREPQLDALRTVVLLI